MFSFLISAVISGVFLIPGLVIYIAALKSFLEQSKLIAAIKIWLSSMVLLAVAWGAINWFALGPLFCRDFNELRGYCPSYNDVNSFVWNAYKHVSPVLSSIAAVYFVRYGLPDYEDKKTDII
jgi:hypothetical protein